MTKKKLETNTIPLTDPSLLKDKKRCPMSGSKNDDFMNVLAGQVVRTLTIPNSDKDEQDKWMIAALNGMMGVAPKDEVEGMLAAQMVATHFATMRTMSSLRNSETIPQQDSNGNLATKLMRTFTAQMEALNRYRGKGQQKMTVEHVHVHAGGQAIVGNVTHPEGGGVQKKTGEQPHAITHAPEQAMPSQNTKREAVPVPSNA